jgi:hypothetical protein
MAGPGVPSAVNDGYPKKGLKQMARGKTALGCMIRRELGSILDRVFK